MHVKTLETTSKSNKNKIKLPIVSLCGTNMLSLKMYLFSLNIFHIQGGLVHAVLAQLVYFEFIEGQRLLLPALESVTRVMELRDLCPCEALGCLECGQLAKLGVIPELKEESPVSMVF